MPVGLQSHFSCRSSGRAVRVGASPCEWTTCLCPLTSLRRISESTVHPICDISNLIYNWLVAGGMVLQQSALRPCGGRLRCECDTGALGEGIRGVARAVPGRPCPWGHGVAKKVSRWLSSKSEGHATLRKSYTTSCIMYCTSTRYIVHVHHIVHITYHTSYAITWILAFLGSDHQPV